jgi:outer membrane protein assembly factor BamE
MIPGFRLANVPVMKLVVLLLALATAGCAYVRPYKIEVNQGNFVTQAQVDKLKAGMTRSQVRTLLGPPLIESAFHGNRWDYQFTLERRGEKLSDHRVAVIFDGDTLKSWDAASVPQAPVIERDPALAPTAKKEDGPGLWSRLTDWWKK